MNDLPDHHCPGCGTSQRAFLRYPWHFCRDCMGRAVDRQGERLEFCNMHAGGGFGWRRAGTEPWTEAPGLRCRIDGRPVLVREARFGGIVAEPDYDGSPDRLERV